MDNKPFRPQIADLHAEHLHEQYGIPAPRVIEITDHIERIYQGFADRNEINWPQGLDELADFVNTPAEFTLGTVAMTLLLAKHMTP